MTSRDELLRDIAACADDALQLQAAVMELTDRAHESVGISTADRALRGKVTGLFFGVMAHLEELNRLVKEET